MPQIRRLQDQALWLQKKDLVNVKPELLNEYNIKSLSLLALTS